MAANGEQACPAYPNPKGCETLNVSIRGDGSTVGSCEVAGKVAQMLKGIAGGIPLACRMDWDSGCLQCQDIYGGAIVNTCDSEAGSPLGGGLGKEETLAEESQDESLHPNPDEPAGSGDGACDPLIGQQAVVELLNKILSDEGFTFSWSPDLANLPPNSFFGVGDYLYADEICGGDAPGVEDEGGCEIDAMMQGRCYCEEQSGIMLNCRCGRISALMLAEGCKQIPAECDREAWAKALWQVYGEATRWLNGGTTNFGFSLGVTVASAQGPEDITCLGSPLVLDLQGDGVELSSLEQGVSFDLLGAGPLRTAWVAGADDALLAIDRNGDGLISGGAELFGEGTFVAGGLARDGFVALAQLDQAQLGGNGNGLLEAGDLQFEQLLLWNDGNQDGRSQASELRTLSDAGLAALELVPHEREPLQDVHGNDLSLRASFLRQDGSAGLLVDAVFLTQAP